MLENAAYFLMKKVIGNDECYIPIFNFTHEIWLRTTFGKCLDTKTGMTCDLPSYVPFSLCTLTILYHRAIRMYIYGRYSNHRIFTSNFAGTTSPNTIPSLTSRQATTLSTPPLPPP
jgi:hypothetical protein